MDSQTYWKNRETEQRKHNIRDEAEYQKHIREIYQNMIDEIEKEINGFYGKYAKKEGITLTEAKKRAAKADIEALGRKAARYVKTKDFSQQANDEMRLYNMTMKVNRLELLKAQIGLEMVAGFDEMQKYYEEILTERAVSEFERQAGILGKTVQNNAKAADAIVNASFHNATYSDRIWMYQGMLKNELSSLLQTGLIQGRNPRRLATHLRKRFGVSQNNAERLMITELARVQTEAQKQSFERNGFEEYTFLALGDACPICKVLDEKHFKVKKMMPGTNAPPMHPRCRCSVAAYEDSEDYEEWLDFLDKGGTAEEWSKLKRTSSAKEDDDYQKRIKQRRVSYRKKNQEKITNIFGDEITFDEKMSDSKWKESKDMILKLTGQYKTRLRTVAPGAHQAAGSVDMGGNMRLSSKRVSDAIHEFAHSISINALTKYKVVDDSEFWKEIKKIRTKYRKAEKEDLKKYRISTYADTGGGAAHGDNIDEFFAEAFTQAKMRELGLKLPDKYGTDFTYSQQVLDTTDKFFGKSVEKESGSGIMNSGAISGALTDKNDPLGKKRNRHAATYYESVRNSKKDPIVKTISQNSGFSNAYISKVYDHVFKNEYDLYGGKKQFDADYDMAESFRRLREGKDIQEHDIILLKHEHLEYGLMNKLGIPYDQAHYLAQSKYDYASAVNNFKKKNNL